MSMFGTRLKELRIQKKQTQSDLSECLKLGGKQVISNYENGSSEPSLDLVIQFANYYNVTVDYLTGNSNFKTTEHKESYDLIGIENFDISGTIESNIQSFLSIIKRYAQIAKMPDNEKERPYEAGSFFDEIMQIYELLNSYIIHLLNVYMLEEHSKDRLKESLEVDEVYDNLKKKVDKIQIDIINRLRKKDNEKEKEYVSGIFLSPLPESKYRTVSLFDLLNQGE